MKERSLNTRVRDNPSALVAGLYEIVVGDRIWEGMDKRDVTKRYDMGKMEKRLARVIDKCWKDQFESADEIHDDFNSGPTNDV